ncbi:hypothetical protein FRB99_005831 [Tulasnella sp. 403]|nr:hypothetical protein FRB99_005831 [Tulasnella sp. 403]
MTHTVTVTGAPYSPPPGTTSNQPPVRREINDLVGDQKQFSLYIQALQRMEDDTQSDVLSHFQIGGIHGLPYVQWDGSGGTRPVSGTRWGGNVRQLIRELQADQSNIRSQTYNLLSRVKTWPAFSNHTVGDGGSLSTSLEGIHDGIHDDIGAGGHMGDPAVAAFDPIFFLHHANVDRLLSLWEALNPSVYVTKGPANTGTFTIQSNAQEDADTDLTPFWNGATTYWDSTACANWEKLGYTYPEFVGLNMGDTAAVQAAIADKVNDLYGGSIIRSAALAITSAVSRGIAALEGHSGSRAIPVADPATLSAANIQAQSFLALPTSSASRSVSSAEPPVDIRVFNPHDHDTHIFEWVVRIHAKKHELGGSYAVLVFLGQPPEDPAEWRSSGNYVGAMHAFVNSVPEECENCRRNGDAVVEGFVTLNEALSKHAHLSSFDVDVVEPYLKKELHWRVQRADRTAVNTADLSTLEVVVYALPMTFHRGDKFPSCGTPAHHHSITTGRQGGYGQQ